MDDQNEFDADSVTQEIIDFHNNEWFRFDRKLTSVNIPTDLFDKLIENYSRVFPLNVTKAFMISLLAFKANDRADILPDYKGKYKRANLDRARGPVKLKEQVDELHVERVYGGVNAGLKASNDDLSDITCMYCGTINGGGCDECWDG